MWTKLQKNRDRFSRVGAVLGLLSGVTGAALLAVACDNADLPAASAPDAALAEAGAQPAAEAGVQPLSEAGSSPHADAAAPKEAGAAGSYDWNLPAGFPAPLVPEDNPMTAEKVELGRYLFYDKRLSGNETQACASCHAQELAFADGVATPTGSTGDHVPKNSPGLANVAYVSTLTWVNPLFTTLEQQIPVPLFGEFPTELGAQTDEAEVLARFSDSELYQRLFSEAFPGESDRFTFKNIVKGLASFCRALLSGNAPYDRFTVERDDAALSASARRGFADFFSEELECHHCHNGFMLSNATRTEDTQFLELAYFNNGLYSLDKTGAYPSGSAGLFEFTNEPTDQGKFRTPSLRNVALTAPYMHDGSIETLEDVLRMYAAGGRNIVEGENAGDGRKNPNKSGFLHGFEMDEQRMKDLVAFLESLTDEQFILDERFSDPFEQ